MQSSPPGDSSDVDTCLLGIGLRPSMGLHKQLKSYELVMALGYNLQVTHACWFFSSKISFSDKLFFSL